MSDLEARPKTRGECKDGERPCPWVGCRHHLGIELMSSLESSPKVRGRGLRVSATDEQIVDGVVTGNESCSLDVAEREHDGMTLDEVGELMDVTRERVRQIEVVALAKLQEEVPNDPEMRRYRSMDDYEGLTETTEPDAEEKAPEKKYSAEPMNVSTEGIAWMTAAGAAIMLGIAPTYVYQLVAKGKIAKREGPRGSAQYLRADVIKVRDERLAKGIVPGVPKAEPKTPKVVIDPSPAQSVEDVINKRLKASPPRLRLTQADSDEVMRRREVVSRRVAIARRVGGPSRWEVTSIAVSLTALVGVVVSLFAR